MLSQLLENSPCEAIGWHYYNGNCFYTSTNEVDQPTARSRCQNENADLASIRDSSEMSFVASIS